MRTGLMMKILFWLTWILNWFLSVWCCGALWYQPWVASSAARCALIGTFVLTEIALLVKSVRRRRLLLAGLALSGGVAAAWLGLQSPTGRHDWDPPFARMPKATLSADGRTVTIENIRDFHYRTEDDYDIRYRTETYDLDGLETLDYSITYWNGSVLFGHIMFSFGFRDGRYLAFSPEARMKRGRKYELLPGFFRQYELIYICATEEDVYQLRTHHRKYEQEEVYLYPIAADKRMLRIFLMELLKRANGLADRPEFYNGIAYNCFSTFGPAADDLPRFDGYGLTTLIGAVNGISDRIAWRRGWLRKTIPDESFEDYKKRHFINQYVENLDNPPNYSQLIRPDVSDKARSPMPIRSSETPVPTDLP